MESCLKKLGLDADWTVLGDPERDARSRWSSRRKHCTRWDADACIFSNAGRPKRKFRFNAVLGPNFPYFASIGNHDTRVWLGYQQKLATRLGRLSNASCIHDLGVQSTCIYKGLLMVFTAPGVRGVGHDAYIRDQLAQSNFAWRISSWHKNQRLMQVGVKGDRAGWGVYEESRKGGAIVATGHAHSYERTHLMSSFQNQEIASTASTLQIEESKSFVFVSGLGGVASADRLWMARGGPQFIPRIRERTTVHCSAHFASRISPTEQAAISRTLTADNQTNLK